MRVQRDWKQVGNDTESVRPAQKEVSGIRNIHMNPLKESKVSRFMKYRIRQMAWIVAIDC